jgi:hypothetical protein
LPDSDFKIFYLRKFKETPLSSHSWSGFFSGKMVITLHVKFAEPHVRETYRPGVQEERNK